MVPDIGLALKKTDWVIPAFVGIMLGIAGFTMDTSSLVKQATNFRAVVPVLVSIYIFSPLAAYGLAKLLAPVGNQDFLPAMMIMAAQAGSLASAIALTMMSGGNRELALICTVMSNGLTFLLTPFILHLSVRSQEDFPVAELMQRMVCVVLVPIILGQLLRHCLWDKTKSIRAFIRIFPQFIILMFVYIGFASGSEKLQEDFNIVLRFLAACVLLHLLLLGLNTLISGLLGLKWPTYGNDSVRFPKDTPKRNGCLEKVVWRKRIRSCATCALPSVSVAGGYAVGSKIRTKKSYL